MSLQLLIDLLTHTTLSKGSCVGAGLTIDLIGVLAVFAHGHLPVPAAFGE